MKTSSIAAGVVCCALLVGCTDSAPSCKETVTALGQNNQDPGVGPFIKEASCESEKYSASLRRCLSKATGQDAVVRCASQDHLRCLKAATSQGALDQCASARDKLADDIHAGAEKKHP
jgi:hypothetical protein